MKTLIFYSSPNKNGNTYKLMNEFIKGLGKEAEILEVFKANIKPCIDCKYCYKLEACSIKDDMTEIYKKINDSDLIVIATPMYFASVPGPLKNLIDRLQVYWSKKYIREDRDDIRIKKGVSIITGGTYWEEMFKPIDETLKLAFGAMDAKIEGELRAINTDENPVEKDEEILKAAYSLGEKFR
ncbi:flavodoxin family protein [Clostridium sp. MSJ-11]|uniref:Flavodoxin family protein n=2 Tax=Clostridium mobile TaxID=2841512 RepID=A0ABS6EI54_9CLOT|nr:flavodoxin family protein [Clostridium mobile]